jgi:MYXO-CTERM domain-containing protein
VSTLSFSHIYRDASFASETAKVEITVNGGTSWIALATYTASQFTGSPAYSAAADNGKFVSFDLSAYAGQTAQVRFRYTDTSSGAWNWYWQIDDVTVTPTPGAAALLGLGGLAAARRRRA